MTWLVVVLMILFVPSDALIVFGLLACLLSVPLGGTLILMGVASGVFRLLSEQ
jgi:hypothetical protein